MKPIKILVVDDDKNICELIRLYLTKEGYQPVLAHDGKEALAKFDDVMPKLVILDIMLPVRDGIAVCREIREQSDVPIIMLTAKGETLDKVLGLEMGADDYVVKPFEPKELLARIKAALRRYDKSLTDRCKELSIDGLSINLNTYEVSVDGERIEMPPKEFEVLYFLMNNKNHVFTREQLLDEVWGYEYFGDARTVDVHIKRIREKIETKNKSWSIKTIWGVGYKFDTSL